ncbi:RMDN1 [Scenedesmus sp. PABB004]|nr:RMDN1 [Scenedesmus sp. PABB004]
MAGPADDIGKWRGLFNWSMKFQDGTSATDYASAQELSPEKREWLERALADMMKDFAERMQEINTALTGDAGDAGGAAGEGGGDGGGGGGASLAEREALCDELLEIVESVDHARDLHTIGGLPTLLALTSSLHASLRWRAAEIMGTCMANNPPVQRWFADGGALPRLMALLGDGDARVVTKALFALGALVRHYDPGLEAFRLAGGLPALLALLGCATDHDVAPAAGAAAGGGGGGAAAAGERLAGLRLGGGAGGEAADAAQARKLRRKVLALLGYLLAKHPADRLAAAEYGVGAALSAALADPGADADGRAAALAVLVQVAGHPGGWAVLRAQQPGLPAQLEALAAAHARLGAEDREAGAEEGALLGAALALLTAPAPPAGAGGALRDHVDLDPYQDGGERGEQTLSLRDPPPPAGGSGSGAEAGAGGGGGGSGGSGGGLALMAVPQPELRRRRTRAAGAPGDQGVAGQRRARSAPEQQLPPAGALRAPAAGAGAAAMAPSSQAQPAWLGGAWQLAPAAQRPRGGGAGTLHARPPGALLLAHIHSSVAQRQNQNQRQQQQQQQHAPPWAWPWAAPPSGGGAAPPAAPLAGATFCEAGSRLRSPDAAPCNQVATLALVPEGSGSGGQQADRAGQAQKPGAPQWQQAQQAQQQQAQLQQQLQQQRRPGAPPPPPGAATSAAGGGQQQHDGGGSPLPPPGLRALGRAINGEAGKLLGLVGAQLLMHFANLQRGMAALQQQQLDGAADGAQQAQRAPAGWRPRMPWQRQPPGGDAGGKAAAAGGGAAWQASEAVRQWVARGIAAEAQMDLRGALACYTNAVTLAPGDAELLCRLAKQWSDLTYEEGASVEQIQEVNAKAVEYAERAITLAPKSAGGYMASCVSRGRLALLSDNKTKVRLAKEAQEAARTALAMEPGNDLAHHLMGRWHYEMAQINFVVRQLIRLVYGAALAPGRFEDALSEFSAAVSLNPNKLIHRVELGRTHLRLGHRREAYEQLVASTRLPVEDVNAKLQLEDAQLLLDKLRKEGIEKEVAKAAAASRDGSAAGAAADFQAAVAWGSLGSSASGSTHAGEAGAGSSISGGGSSSSSSAGGGA